MSLMGNEYTWIYREGSIANLTRGARNRRGRTWDQAVQFVSPCLGRDFPCNGRLSCSHSPQYSRPLWPKSGKSDRSIQKVWRGYRWRGGEMEVSAECCEGHLSIWRLGRNGFKNKEFQRISVTLTMSLVAEPWFILWLSFSVIMRKRKRYHFTA